jgi:hypothetical protein
LINLIGPTVGTPVKATAHFIIGCSVLDIGYSKKKNTDARKSARVQRKKGHPVHSVSMGCALSVSANTVTNGDLNPKRV